MAEPRIFSGRMPYDMAQFKRYKPSQKEMAAIEYQFHMRGPVLPKLTSKAEVVPLAKVS